MPYLFKQYLRSNRYVAPFLFYLVSIAFTYSQKPLYVMTAYMFSCIFTYCFSAWLMYSLASSEELVQQQLIILHVEKENYYYIGKIVFILMLVILFSTLAVFYPIAGGFFIRKVYALDVFGALLSHWVIGLLGISAAILFDQRLINSGKLRLLYLVGVLIVSIIQVPLSMHYSFVKWITIVFPPAYLIISRFGLIDVMSFSSFYKLMADLIVAIAYSIILIFLSLKFMRNKKF